MKSRKTTEASKVRERILELCEGAGGGHVTTAFSVVEILLSLYAVMDRDRDRFILSEGHAAPALYAVMESLGLLDTDWVEKFNSVGDTFAVFPNPGITMSVGSLGHGLGIGTGIALALALTRAPGLVWVLVSDGECYEGSTWEAATVAAHHNLNNLVVLLNRNGMCATDFTENACRLEPLARKWRGFGWKVVTVDGHDREELELEMAAVRARYNPQPTVIICRTVKGKGVDFISNEPLWHSRALTGRELEKAREQVR